MKKSCASQLFIVFSLLLVLISTTRTFKNTTDFFNK